MLDSPFSPTAVAVRRSLATADEFESERLLMSLGKQHVERHHNPVSHIVAAAASAVGAALFVHLGHPVVGALVSVVTVVNVLHAVNEYRRPVDRDEAAQRHLDDLRDRIRRELGEAQNGQRER